MTTQELFDLVYNSSLSKLDMCKMVQELTDGFEEAKLKMLYKEFAFFVLSIKYSWAAKISDEEIKAAIVEPNKQGMFTAILKKNNIEYDERAEWYNIPIKSQSYPYLKHFIRLDKFERVLHQIGQKSFSGNVEEPVQPIKWLKSEEALWQLIESLKKNGLIQSRETEDIIQHFEVTGREAKQAKLEPISWLKSKALLAYFIRQLNNSGSIDVENIWHELEPHFYINGKAVTGLRQSEASTYSSPKSSDIIDRLIKQ